MKKKYDQKVFKLGLSMGEICHHRKKNGGCIFCLPETFTDDIKSENIKKQIEYLLLKMKKYADIFIAYFQDETTLDVDFEQFKNKIEKVLQFKEIKEITISTRPDVLKIKHLDFLSGLELDVNIEVGIQTIHNKSLEYLNRGHSFSDITNAVKLLKMYNFRIGAHLILGIPGENFKDNLETIDFINSAKIDEVKIHNLVAYQNTKLGEAVKNSEVNLLDFAEYLDLLTEIIPYIKPEIVISRLFTSNVNRTGKAINPFPDYKKNWMNKLTYLMNYKDVFQGQKLKEK